MRFILSLLIIICVVPIISADLFPTPSQDVIVGFTDGTSESGVSIFMPEKIFNSSAATSNSTEFWITNIGSLSGVNATQFENNAGTLSIIINWFNGAVGDVACLLTGCTMEGDINMDANDIIDVGNITLIDSIKDDVSLSRMIINDTGTFKFYA